MKQFSLLIFLLIILSNIQCQSSTNDTVNCVIYKMGKPTMVKKDTPTTNPEIRKLLDNVNLAYDYIECELFYTKSKSLFKMVEKLNLENDKTYLMASIFARGLYYKDLENKEKIKQEVTYDELLNITLPFDEYKWEITTETKIINGYKCYKATAVYEEFDKTRNKKNVFYPEVWFAPEIPVPFGPRGLDGLPGLVLEGKFSNHAYFYATKIIFNVENPKTKLEKPKKGKFVTVDEYQDFMSKSFNALINN